MKPKIDEATNPPNAKMHAWAKRRAIEAFADGSKLSIYTYACWHVVTTAHGGEFRALWRILLGACGRKLDTWRAALEIWYERTFQGKTDEDFDRECEETARTIQSLYAAAVPAKLRAAKAMFQHQYERRVEGVGCGDDSLRAYLRDEAAREGLPTEFMGYPVTYIVTGRIEAFTGEAKATPVACPTCRGARHLQHSVTREIRTCPDCNAGGVVDKSLRRGTRWA